MYSNTSLVPQQQQLQQQQGAGLLPSQYQHHQGNMHPFTHHQMGLDPGMLGVPKMEPNSLITPEIDKEKEKQARENHCEIERRRRVKMAAYFNELCVMVPTCNTLQRKPDKLTILRMASSHMRNLRGNHSNSMSNDCAYKPSFLTDQELKHLILEAADGFLFVAQCDSGNIIYVSDAVQSVLSYSPNDWGHRSLLDFVHPDDLDKVKDQLSTQENSSNNTTGRILDLKTGTVKKEGHPNSVRSHIGSRRSFVCRVRLGNQHQNHRSLLEENSSNIPGGGYWSASNPRVNRTCLQSNTDSADPNRINYSVVHITGYTKVWPPSNQNQPGSNNSNNPQASIYHSLDEHGNASTNFHLIAIARIQMTSAPNDLVNSSNGEFVSRHDQNGNITFVDQRVTGLIGLQPSDMLKKSIADFLIPQDQQMFKDQLKTIHDTKQTQPVQMTLHFMSSISGEVIPFTSSAYAFCNPCNDAFEFIVCTHTSQKYSEPERPTVNQLNQMSTPLSTTTNLDHANQGSNYNYNLHNMSQQQGTYPNSAYQQQHDQMNYQNQFMQQAANNQFANTHLTSSNDNSSTSQANYGNYLIMPSN
jgi:aryl hydrocarbon receptor nuclear translocator